MSFFSELKRRNVLRVATAYVVVAWAIVQVVVTLRELFPEIPVWPGQALIVLLALGVVPVLLFAWSYELTADGFKRDAEVGDGQSRTEKAGHQLISLTVVAAIIGTALFAWTRDGNETTVEMPVPVQSVAKNSIAVLPFANMSADPQNEYFSDGLSETLLHLLAQVQELKVAARTSSFAFKGKDTDIRDIGAALGVAHVLEGSVRRDMDRIRITAQLIRANDGFHVWSETYDRDLTDVFAIQDEIASTVGVMLLANVLNPAEATRRRAIDTTNFKAYDFYLQGRAELLKASFEALQLAEQYLNAALNEDPDFLDAKVQLVLLVRTQADTGMRPFPESLQKITSLLDEVLASDPQHTWARSQRIELQAHLASAGGDNSAWQNAAVELRAIVTEAPNDIEVRLSLVSALRRTGNFEEAITIQRDVLEIDPLNAYLHELLAGLYSDTRNYAAARDALLHSVEIEPAAPNAWRYLGDAALQLGDGTLAVDSYLHAVASDSLDPEMPGRVAEELYLLGLPEQANEFHQRVLNLAPNAQDARNLEMLRAVSAGEIEQAVQFARDIIESEPERPTAWKNAWKILLFTSVGRGTEKEDIALMDAYVQDFSDLDKLEVSYAVNLFRGNTIDVLASVKTEAELQTFTRRLDELYQQRNIGKDAIPEEYLDWAIFFGNTDVAIKLALDDVFSNPVTSVRLWRLRFARPFMQEFMSDPRIQAALQRWEKQEERIRSEIRDYLAKR